MEKMNNKNRGLGEAELRDSISVKRESLGAKELKSARGQTSNKILITFYYIIAILSLVAGFAGLLNSEKLSVNVMLGILIMLTCLILFLDFMQKISNLVDGYHAR